MENQCCSAEKPRLPVFRALDLYRPLIVAAMVAVAGAAALYLAGLPAMNAFMGLFLLFLGALKLFSLSAFAGLYAGYDPLAMQIRAYGYVYPFIELVLGFFYLSGLFLLATSILTMAVFLINTAGVVKVLRSGAQVQCGCAGAGFSLPVGRVTLFENMAMIFMAGVSILQRTVY